MNKDKIIAKQAKLIKKTNRLLEYLNDSIMNGEDADYEEVMDHKLSKIKQLESELAQLQSEPEEDMYPASFVEWVIDPDNVFYEDGVYYVCDATMEKGCTLKKAFDYWKSNKPK